MKDITKFSVTSKLMSLQMNFVSSLTTFTMTHSSWFPLNVINVFVFTTTLSFGKSESCFVILIVRKRPNVEHSTVELREGTLDTVRMF